MKHFEPDFMEVNGFKFKRSGFYTVNEISKAFKVSEKTVHKHIENGEFISKKFSSKHYITGASIVNNWFPKK